MLKNVVKLGDFVEERKSGEKIRYIVQTAPPEMEDAVIEHMTKFFLPREPMCSHRILGDPVSTKTLQELWREAVQGGTTLVALQIVDGEEHKLIGANVTPISEKTPAGDKKFEGDNFNDVLEALIDVAQQGNIYEKYGVDRYMTGYGLSVDADFHGYKIGERILESRRPLCQLLGVGATGTVFTASSSQHIAAKVGFETLAEFEYSTYTVNGKKPFANLPGKMLMMGMKI
uniref:Uncharacterized protein n=1 Tax=Lygus hesperus TaxID=30085 RepID=A0A0A9WE96_LYGHE